MTLSKSKLKELFQSGKKPSGDDFANLIDSLLHVTSEILTASRSTANEDEARGGVTTDKYMTPYLVLKAIEHLTRIRTLPNLSADIDVKISTAVDGLVAGAPSALNTLNELAEALNDDDNAFNSLRGLIDRKEPTINKNSGFNLIKSNDFRLDDANLLSTSKATYGLYDLVDAYIGTPLFYKKNTSTLFASDTLKYKRFSLNAENSNYHVVVKIHPNQAHINYEDVRVVFMHKRKDNLDVHITNGVGIHYAPTRFDIVILREEGLGAAKSDSYHHDSSCCFASSKAVNDLRDNLQGKIDGKAAVNHTHPFKTLKVGETNLNVIANQTTSVRITHNKRTNNYVVVATPTRRAARVHIINKSTNYFDISIVSDVSFRAGIFYVMISTV